MVECHEPLQAIKHAKDINIYIEMDVEHEYYEKNEKSEQHMKMIGNH